MHVGVIPSLLPSACGHYTLWCRPPFGVGRQVHCGRSDPLASLSFVACSFSHSVHVPCRVPLALALASAHYPLHLHTKWWSGCVSVAFPSGRLLGVSYLSSCFVVHREDGE